MAWQLPSFCIGNLIAAASMASNQFHCVKADSTNNQFALCDTDGEVVLGVLQDNPASGEAGDIMCLGVTKVVVGTGETLVAGQTWGVDANGEAKTIEGTVTGADVGDYAAGMVLEGAAAGELASVTIGFPTFKVEAQ
jgi:hypothetical protein